MTDAKPYLAICSLYKDHADYLREWIEFHRIVGVERFFLYDNESSDDHEEVLGPYVERGVVQVHPWPSPRSVERGVPWGIIDAFTDAVQRHREDARWIAFIDVDEFLFSPTRRPLPEVLEGFEQFSGVEVSRLEFGPAEHSTKPDGLVIENYLARRPYLTPEEDREHVKSIVDPTRTTHAFNAHGFFYSEGYAVREDGERAPQKPPGRMCFPLGSLLRINHYVTKSIEEYARKAAQWAAAGRPFPDDDREGLFAWLSMERDETITMYVPALREALSQPVG